MAQKWSVTKSAINSYGDKMLSLHPEYWDAPPYAQPEAKTVRGSGLIKGSKEAKKRMAYLRSLRGKGSYNKAALKGGSSYNKAALKGGSTYNKAALKGGSTYNKAALKGGSTYNKAALKGGFDLSALTDFAGNFGSSLGDTLTSIGRDFGQQALDYVRNPENVKQALTAVAKPASRSLLTKFKNWIQRKRGKKTASTGGEREKMITYLRWLKENQPEKFAALSS